jgi:hypothetical protein
LDQILGYLQNLTVLVTRLADIALPFQHPHLVVNALLDGSIGLLLKVWFGFILSTTDLETGHAFTENVTIQRFEPMVRLASNAGLGLVVVWASYRLMWGQGAMNKYTVRLMLPRLLMSAVLINMALPLFQVFVEASNAASQAIQTFGTVPQDWGAWWRQYTLDQTAGVWQVITTAVLIVGYDVLGVAYVIRYTILIVLAITAPLAGLLFILPDTNHWAAKWASVFVANLFMQPAQLFVLAVGFALENGGHSAFHHLFALAALLVVFKVPGALHGTRQVARKLESAVVTSAKFAGRAVVRA